MMNTHNNHNRNQNLLRNSLGKAQRAGNLYRLQYNSNNNNNNYRVINSKFFILNRYNNNSINSHHKVNKTIQLNNYSNNLNNLLLHLLLKSKNLMGNSLRAWITQKKIHQEVF